VQKEADEILAEAVERDLDGPEFHGYDNDSKEDGGENTAADQEAR
jgi:hypothetical protein